MHKVYLLLGSNMGNSMQMLHKAISKIEKQIGLTIRKSNIYATEAWGKRNQPDFLNQIIVVETTLDAEKVLSTILKIESQLGRIRTVKNAPRTIDIDILFFDKLVTNHPHLIVPHPHIAQRRFVLVPLNALAPRLKHPVSGLSVHQLLLACSDKLNVKRI